MLRRFALAWTPLAVAATLLVGVSYAVTQATLRGGADDPQVQLAEDAAARLAAGAPAESVVPPGPVDLRASLATWVIVYDRSRSVVASSAADRGHAPAYVLAVLDGVRPGQVSTVTWDTHDGIRQATVVTAYPGGWVVSGRSLRRVETRIDQVGTIALLGWMGTLAVTAAATLLVVAAAGRSPSNAPPADPNR